MTTVAYKFKMKKYKRQIENISHRKLEPVIDCRKESRKVSKEDFSGYPCIIQLTA